MKLINKCKNASGELKIFTPALPHDFLTNLQTQKNPSPTQNSKHNKRFLFRFEFDRYLQPTKTEILSTSAISWEDAESCREDI